MLIARMKVRLVGQGLREVSRPLRSETMARAGKAARGGYFVLGPNPHSFLAV